MKRWVLLLMIPLAAQGQEHFYTSLTASYYSPCFPLFADDTGQFLSGVSGADVNFVIAIHADNEATETEFQTTADIEAITTIGTYQAPQDATHIRFGECATAGTYQIMPHNDFLGITGAQTLTFTFDDGNDTLLDKVVYLHLNPISLADIEAESVDALESLHLDHLLAVAESDEAVNGSLWCNLLAADGDCSTFETADALSQNSFINTNASNLSAYLLPIVGLTADAGGSVTTLVDAAIPDRATNAFVGMEVVVASLETNDERACITAYNGTTTFTLYPPLSAAPDGDVYSVVSSSGCGALVQGITAAGVADLFTVDSGETSASAVAGSVVDEIIAGGGSADTIADAVWDELQSEHVGAGSFGETATEIASVLADTGTDGVVLANDAITAAKIAADAIGASELAANAMGASEIANDAITAAKIAANAITASEIAANAITASEFANDTITAAKIATDAIGADEIANNAIDAGALAANAISATTIATDAIGAAEIADDAIDVGAIAAGAITDSEFAVTIAEPTGVPAWNASLVEAISYIMAWYRNEVQQTATVKTLRNDADNADLVTCGVSDDSTTFQVDECTTAP